MPELPEVEAARKVAEKWCAGKVIKDAIFTEGGGGPRDGEFDDIVVEGAGSADEASKILKGKRLVACKRKGKQQWWELDAAPHVCWHFGMTGAFSIKGLKGSEYVRYSVDTAAWPPKFTKVRIVFADGTELAFSDPRRLGRVKFVSNPLTEPPVSELGWDAHLEMRPLEAFRADLAARALPIKALLLSQDYVAGIGNWIADEVLYQAKIHPESAACALDSEDVSRLHTAIKTVVGHAVSVDAESDKFPKEWLFHYRWGKGKGSAKMPDGNAIEFVTVGGRTSAVVRAVQGSPKRAVKVTASSSIAAVAVASKGKKTVVATSSVEVTAVAFPASEPSAAASSGVKGRKGKLASSSSPEAEGAGSSAASTAHSSLHAGASVSMAESSALQASATVSSSNNASGKASGLGTKRRRPAATEDGEAPHEYAGAAGSSAADAVQALDAYAAGGAGAGSSAVVTATKSRKVIRMGVSMGSAAAPGPAAMATVKGSTRKLTVSR